MSAVPIRPVQPEHRLHGSHRLPGGRLRAAVAGRPLVHHRGGRRQRHRRAERALLDSGATLGARRRAWPQASPGRGYARIDDLREAVHLRRLPRRRRRVRAATRRADGCHGQLSHGRLFHGRSRRRHLRLRRRAVLRVDGRPATQRPDRRHGGDPHPARATGSSRPTAGSSPTATRSSSAPWAANTSTRPVVGMAPTPTGKGYWLVAADGGIFAYGDALFFGSMGGKPLNCPCRRHGSHADREGVLARRVRRRRSSPTATPCSTARPAPSSLNEPVVGMAPFGNDAGYWLVAADGGIFTYGGAPFLGSPA